MPPAGPFGYWRVWFEDDQVRVARDTYLVGFEKKIQPEHLALTTGEYDTHHHRRIHWQPHDEGARIPSISVSDFTAWLDQGGYRR